MTMSSFRRWLPAGVVGVAAFVGAGTNALAHHKTITALLSSSGTGCTVPSGHVYAAHAVGLAQPGNVAVCNAYSTGSSAWHYCAGYDPATPSTVPVTNVALVEDLDTNYTLLTTWNSDFRAWGTQASCTHLSGGCTWTAYALGKN
jgi:hypothetical protein